MSARGSLPCSAGIYEQADGGWALVPWSSHSTPALAAKAARRYARRLVRGGSATGGSKSWSAWWREGDASAVEVAK